MSTMCTLSTLYTILRKWQDVDYIFIMPGNILLSKDPPMRLATVVGFSGGR